MAGTRSLKVRPHAKAAQLLLTARRARKLTVGQVAEATRLPVKHIEALESGDFSVFAAEVYGRGAYLRYALFLGLKEAQAERLVTEALVAARQRVPLKVFTPFGLLRRLTGPGTVITAGVMVIGLVVGGYLVWQLQSFLRLPHLRLLEPGGVILAAEELTVQGIAEVSARVVVNGEPVLLNERGEFSLNIFLHPGLNVLRVEAENAAGRKKVLEKHLLLPRA